MKQLTLLASLLMSFAVFSQSDCGYQTEGDLHWINPEGYNLEVSAISDKFDGSNCNDQFVINFINNTEDPESFSAYISPTVSVSHGFFFQEFTLDFAELLTQIDDNKWVQFAELDVISDDPVKPTVTQRFKVRAKKKILADGRSFVWRITVHWQDVGGSSAPVVDHVWVDQEAVSGGLHFRVQWSQNVAKGESTIVTIESGLRNAAMNVVHLNVSTDPESVNPSDYVGLVHFNAPYTAENFQPTAINLGIISTNSVLYEGHGLVIRTPIE